MENMSNNWLIISRFVSRKIDGLIVHKDQRWYSYFGVLLFFLFRMVWTGGYYAIAYFLGFYTLQNVVLYMTPSGIPSITDVSIFIIGCFFA